MIKSLKMDKVYFENELKNHIRYFDQCVKEQDALSKDSTGKVEEIIKKKQGDGELSKADFVVLEENGFKANAIQMDLVKVSSRIRLLFQLGVGEKFDVEKMLGAEQRLILKQILDLDADFLMMESEGGRMEYRSDEMKQEIENMCEGRVKEDELEDRYNALYKKYFDYNAMVNSLKNAPAKETDNR